MSWTWIIIGIAIVGLVIPCIIEWLLERRDRKRGDNIAY